jgi:GH18 family chitinase
VFDAREAFANSHLKVGEAWVFDKGDKIDWNHPNRVGHAHIARWLAANPAFKAQCLPN